jgi:cysteinyl-tRNA synthetase
VLRLHDTAFGEVAPLDLREAGKVSIYVCGPTVYREPHLGHGRFALVFDVLRRYLQWTGLEVLYVSNITDVDDKIIQQANEEGRTAEQVARTSEGIWYDAVGRLGVDRPDADPHATDYIPQMIDLVARLADKGLAYETSDGVYLETEQVPGYGLLARQPLDSLRAGARVEVGDEKRSALDFALWKKAKPGEPWWESPWGPGRPGWHTECVVMSLDLLGEGFDLHGGGLDLQFPHHENERAQAVALGKEFSRRWMHNGMLVDAQGHKMSKSTGNVISLPELLDRWDPRVYRLLVLRSHYRSPLRVGDEAFRSAQETLRRLDDFARRSKGVRTGVASDPGVVQRFRARMDSDLDTPGALAVLFDALRDANAALDRSERDSAAPLAAAVVELSAALGLRARDEDEEVDAAALDLVRLRDDARRRRDFGAADAIRAQLVERGWVVEDSPDGTRVHR